MLGWRTVVLDGRSHFASPARFPRDVDVRVNSLEDPLTGLVPDRWTMAAVMSHSFSQDRAAVSALAKLDLCYVGVLGPRRRTQAILEQEGIAAWKAWVEKHHAAVSAMGGPLGKTKKITGRGIADVSNEMGAFMVVRAESHEAAAKLFEKHPHFTIFPGESVEIMPVLPIPGA